MDLKMIFKKNVGNSGNLSNIGRKDFKQVFKELNRERGTTVFFSSHVVSDVEEICNKVLFISGGYTLKGS